MVSHMNAALANALHQVTWAHKALVHIIGVTPPANNLQWATMYRKQSDVKDAEAVARSLGASDDQIIIAQRQAEA